MRVGWAVYKRPMVKWVLDALEIPRQKNGEYENEENNDINTIR